MFSCSVPPQILWEATATWVGELPAHACHALNPPLCLNSEGNPGGHTFLPLSSSQPFAFPSFQMSLQDLLCDLPSHRPLPIQMHRISFILYLPFGKCPRGPQPQTLVTHGRREKQGRATEGAGPGLRNVSHVAGSLASWPPSQKDLEDTCHKIKLSAE